MTIGMHMVLDYQKATKSVPATRSQPSPVPLTATRARSAETSMQSHRRLAQIERSPNVDEGIMIGAVLI